MWRKAVLAAWMFLFAVLVFAQTQHPAPPPVLQVRGLGAGAVELGGPWQFHTGDERRWAAPELDDSGWQQISTSQPWGSQGFPGYTGFAWYRRHLDVARAADGNYPDTLLMPQQVDDAYEVYWNGVMVGQSGHLPPHPSWPYNWRFRTFRLPITGSGTLAIRAWKAPLLFVDPATLGGLNGSPVLGSRQAILEQEMAVRDVATHQVLYDYTLIVLYGFIMLNCLLLWSKVRKADLFLWLAVFTATPILLALLQGSLPVTVSISYRWARALNQPLYALNHISLWFLLLWLLRLDGRRRLMRWTWILAEVTFVAGLADGALAFFWGTAGPGLQRLDAILTVSIMAVEVLPFAIIAIGVRQKLELPRWCLAISALIVQSINTIGDASAAGQRFTHWTLYDTVNSPLFSIKGVVFGAETLAQAGLFLSILYAVFRHSTEQQARQSVLEREMHSAQEIQRVLVPDTVPSPDGFAVTSAYRPALEVGGDFFQIIGEKAGSTLIALGDVSGKGLKAAMNVSVIVGVLRSAADGTIGPAAMLERLNECMNGRLQGGFITALILRLQPNGSVTIANAGHLPPFLNRHELRLEGSLPLGLVPGVTYEEFDLQLQEGDQLSLYTDGLLEARDAATGEIYGFERMQHLLALRPTAQQAMSAAVAFGQDDDITILTLTRLAAGEESSISVTTPLLEPSPVQL